MKTKEDKEQTEHYGEINEDNVDEYGPLAIETIILNVLNLFVITPLLIMLTWNVLVNYYVPVESIGYGGAWVVIIVRNILLSNVTREEETGKETETEMVLRTHATSVRNIRKVMFTTTVALVIAVLLTKIL